MTTHADERGLMRELGEAEAEVARLRAALIAFVDWSTEAEVGATTGEILAHKTRAIARFEDEFVALLGDTQHGARMSKSKDVRP